jgi:hypothetical protein
MAELEGMWRSLKTKEWHLDVCLSLRFDRCAHRAKDDSTSEGDEARLDLLRSPNPFKYSEDES